MINSDRFQSLDPLDHEQAPRPIASYHAGDPQPDSTLSESDQQSKQERSMLRGVT